MIEELIGKRVRVRYANYGRINFIGEGEVVWARDRMIRVRMPDGKYYWLPLPHHRGDRIEVLESGKWKVWMEIPAKRQLKIKRGAIILLPPQP